MFHIHSVINQSLTWKNCTTGQFREEGRCPNSFQKNALARKHRCIRFLATRETNEPEAHTASLLSQ